MRPRGNARLLDREIGGADQEAVLFREAVDDGVDALDGDWEGTRGAEQVARHAEEVARVAAGGSEEGPQRRWQIVAEDHWQVDSLFEHLGEAGETVFPRQSVLLKTRKNLGWCLN